MNYGINARIEGKNRSVNFSQKITGAMKMISSAKLRKVQSALEHLMPFRNQLQNTINNLLGPIVNINRH